MNEPIKSVGEFLQGQKDCQAGIPHKDHRGSDYDRGYSAQYSAEQVMSELSRRGNRGLKVSA